MTDTQEELERYKYERAHAWLCDVRDTAQLVHDIETEIIVRRDELQSFGMCVGFDIGKPTAVSGDDRLVEHLCRLEEQIVLLQDISKEGARKYRAAIKVFRQLNCNNRACIILMNRYVRSKTWGEISGMINYSESQVKRIARAATIECYDLMPHEWRDPYYQAI